MKHTTPAIFFLALAMTSGQGNAQTPPDNRTLTGLGSTPCQMAIALADRPDYRDRLAQWATGYWSGMNAALPAQKRRNLRGLLPADAAQIVITECRLDDWERPIAAAAAKLFESQALTGR